MNLATRSWLAAAALAVACAGAAQAQPVADRDKIIDIAELRETMARAAAPMAERMKQTTLKDRFARVAELLQQQNVDETELLTALRSLKGEIDTFTGGWSEVEEPLWQGQDHIGKTIDRVRMFLAKGASKEPSPENVKQIQNYESRLTELAKAIQAEPDEVRQRRLKTLFANTLSLKKLVETYSRIDLQPASQTMLSQLVKALMYLEDQLTTATFQVERARIVLGQTGDFVGGYIGIVEDLVQAKALAEMLGEMQANGTGVGGVMADLGTLTGDVSTFTQLMEGFMTKIASQIEAEATRLAGNFEAAEEATPLDIDAEIERYLSAKP